MEYHQLMKAEGLESKGYYYIRKAGISQMCDKVAGSSPKGRGKGAMVKGGCFLPQKTRKALVNQGLLC